MRYVPCIVLFCSALIGPAFNSIAYTWSTSDGELEFNFNGTFRPETFYGRNISLLNSHNLNDKVWFARHTLDIKFGTLYGKKRFGTTALELSIAARNKSVWGHPGSIATTTDAEVKLLDAVGKKHRHAIPRHIFWIRELWLWLDINTLCGLNLDAPHVLLLGSFPFMLGRGIALGDAYAVGPEVLGFYSDGAVDQFAFGAKLTGTVLKNTLTYDVYAAILQNKSSNLNDTNEKIFGQEFGRLKTPARGYGKINFVIATRANWQVFRHERWGKLSVEPYALLNHDPEQTIEFLGDATSKLGTIGLAGEYYGNKFEFGFDYAFNLGHQRVKGWDRNQIKEENRSGTVALVNTHVVDQSNAKILFTSSTSDAQKIINNSFRSESENGQKIGSIASGTTELINASNRFRNPYINKYEGWMFVADMAWWLYKRDLQLAVTAGIATGDENPNEETIDGRYSGFIGLQELYYGKRVKSAFVLGSAGKLKRPLSVPDDTTQLGSPFAQTVSGFTNLVFWGTALSWKPQDWKRVFAINPNLLFYWQEKPAKKFDAATNKQLNCLASTFLGVETNLFVEYYIYETFKLFFVTSAFFPGGHYKDIKGKPLSKEQEEFIDRLDRTGFSADRLPNISDDIAYTLNFGFEFRF